MARWTVTRQVPATDRSPDGSVQRGVDVTYQLEGGSSHTIFVPYAEYGVDAVKARIASHAATAAGIDHLSGDV